MLTGGDGDNNNNNADSIKNTDSGTDGPHGDAPMVMMAMMWITLPCKSLELVAHGC